jgi:hypothetical protein
VRPEQEHTRELKKRGVERGILKRNPCDRRSGEKARLKKHWRLDDELMMEGGRSPSYRRPLALLSVVSILALPPCR